VKEDGMTLPIEDAVNELFESRGMTVDAGALHGSLQVLDRDALLDLVRNLVANAEGEAKLASTDGSGISKMLDDYMRQNADLRQKEGNARRRAQEAEIQLKMAEGKIKDLAASAREGGAGASPAPGALEPFLAFDPAEGNALFEEIDSAIVGLETALNTLEDAEGSFAFVSRVAEMRTDFNNLHEEFMRAVSAFQAVAAPFQSGAGEATRALQLVEASCSVRCRVSEGRLLKKSVDFFKSMIQSE
jgi:hypothetical protein